MAIFIALLGQPGPAAAQDLIGFDAQSYGSVVLSTTQSAGASWDELEVTIDDYNNEHIVNYSSESVFAKMGLSVGRLDVLTDKGVFPCTAFIVDENHILTNHHCVPGILKNPRAKATRIDSVMFVAGYTQPGVEEGTEKYTVIAHPVETSEDLDYSVLKVIGNPSRQFGALQLAAKMPADGDPYWVIGHPMGEAQRISREQCRANRPALSDRRLLHTCDTLPGNSGSPVIDASLQMVVGLHHAGSKRDAVNFAIPMAEILSQSEVLKAALTTPAPEQPAPVDPAPVDPSDGTPTVDTGTPEAPPVDQTADALCNALYQEAKAYDQCFAYDVYIEQCDTHPLSIVAKGYLAANCTEEDAATAPPPIDSTPIDPGQTIDPTPPKIEQTYLRPWCRSSNLNTTERTICNSQYLAGLDAQMESTYNAQSHVSASEQGSWLKTRNSCGANGSCIAQAVIDRIAYLQNPPAPAPSPGNGGVRVVKGNYTLGSNRCYIVAASRTSIAEATGFISQWLRGRSGVRMFQSDNGYYGIVLETVSRSGADARLAQLKSRNAIPGDSYCSTGRRFVAEVLWNGGAPAPSPSPVNRVMYVDNNNSGGLNVRTGPSTSYHDFTELRPGTQVTVFAQQDKWSNIRMPDGRTGWVYTPLLTRTKPRVTQCRARVVNLQPYSTHSRNSGLGFLNVRSDNSTRARVISELYLGDQVQVLAQKGNWARVQCLSGQCQTPYRGTGGVTGWASKKYLSIRCN
ncbi:SH3 domain-containing protein [Pseudoponticoccus marisrubri]|uniref:SH3b domain-containing protein n=1 Tax=Pseudoponticoccus marisrubri TaxID=1685382 RepID=A0A0W7WFC6_9RHOB|nr:SH3 domain-containing protein [Pseudoponticoccus marisrubri]KUF09331.1 hypothetical protein AVJ23_17970 [Pseudoponticoccus marisrubri]